MQHSTARLAPAAPMGAPLTLLFAGSVAVIVFNLFASQPLVGVIGPSVGLGAGATALVPTVTMLGYAAGLLVLVPLTDLVENRQLIVVMLAANVACLAAAALASSPVAFIVAVFGVGMFASTIQMLVPVAAFLAPEDERGRVVGTVMSGLVLGILLSRPIASLIAGGLGWRAVYGLAGLPVGAIAAVLAWRLPRRVPERAGGYLALVRSMWTLVGDEPVLRRRALSAALCMGCFSAFWGVVALLLAAPPFGLGSTGMALFGLAGAGAVLIAPIAGRLGDRGRTRSTTVVAHLALLAGWAVAALAGSAGAGWGLAGLVAAALVLDACVIADQTLGRRAINLIRPEARGRMNGLFTGIFFVGGAAGSWLAGAAFAWKGWSAVCAVGAGFALAALALDLVAGDVAPARVTSA